VTDLPFSKHFDALEKILARAEKENQTLKH
jgi:hypothetical protein